MKTDREEQFDASVGLDFSLRAFEQYRANGVLSASVRAIPGIRGQCQVFLELVEGKVVACYVKDRTGHNFPLAKEVLLNLEQRKGFLHWTFRKAPTPTGGTPPPVQIRTPSTSQKLRSPIPVRVVDSLDARLLQRWTPEQRQCLSLVFSLIDGRHEIDEIKARVSLPPAVVDEVIQVLISLQVIAL